MTRKDAIESVARYIYQFEEHDFFNGDEEPSRRHVYYCALVVLFGQTEADQALTRAINERSQ